GVERPKFSPCSITCGITCVTDDSSMKKFINPGPAISTDLMLAADSSRCSMIDAAMSLGFFFACLVNVIAIFEEKSPFALSLGVSILMSGISDTIPDFFTAFSSSSDNPAFKFIIDPRSLIYIGICLIIDLVQTIHSQ